MLIEWYRRRRAQPVIRQVVKDFREYEQAHSILLESVLSPLDHVRSPAHLFRHGQYTPEQAQRAVLIRVRHYLRPKRLPKNLTQMIREAMS